MTVECLHFRPGQSLPMISDEPFRAGLVVDAGADQDWRERVSAWLVRSGCLYLMAWGKDCEIWHDCVDQANRQLFDPEDIPDDRFVMTTWHDKESLDEAFWFAKFVAFHPTVELPRMLIINIAQDGRCDELVRLYNEQAPLEDDE